MEKVAAEDSTEYKHVRVCIICFKESFCLVVFVTDLLSEDLEEHGFDQSIIFALSKA